MTGPDPRDERTDGPLTKYGCLIFVITGLLCIAFSVVLWTCVFSAIKALCGG